MLLTIDAGNTEIKLGCFEDAGSDPLRSWRVTTGARRTADEYGLCFTQFLAARGISAASIDEVAIASVVPALDATLDAACRTWFGVAPLFLRAQEQTLIRVATACPAQVGADLVAAAIGGRERFGAPLIVACFGTASVFVAISPAGEYLGYAIAPGIVTSLDALIERAARLPRIALEPPPSALGRSTQEALQSGFTYGFAGQTEALVARLRDELGVKARVIATGGLAGVAAQQTAAIDAVDSSLVLFGLALFARAATR